MRKSEFFIIGLIIISFAICVYFYNQFPEKIASHWNAQGQVNGYMSRFWGLFLMPIISVGMFILFLFIPKIDPLKKNIQQFRKYFDNFIVLIFLFLFYIFILTIVWNLGMTFNMIQFMIPAFVLLFYYSGVLIKNSKRNWFIGIRTPWTLSNDRVWKKTHDIGGKLFKISAVISILGLVFEKYAIFFVLVPIILTTIYVYVYSYFEFHRKQKR
jgi:uncharacterized membrane protein